MLKQFIKMVHPRPFKPSLHHHLRAVRFDPSGAPRDL
jgi:hypothetical protein